MFTGALVLGLAVLMQVPSTEEASPDTACAAASEPRYVRNEAFGPGERLEFSVEYGLIKAGTAVMEVGGPEEYEGLLAYRITATALSNPTFSTFFRVNDLNEALLDVVQMHTLYFRKDLEEGNYQHEEEVFFDQDMGLVYYPEADDDEEEVVEMPPHSLDVLSCFYVSRTLPLEPGDVFHLDCHVDNDNYPLRVVVHERDRIRVPAGEFDCVMVQPMLASEGLFDQQGELYVWLTDDERHMPVLMTSAIVIGEITCVLEEYTTGTPIEVANPGFEVWEPEYE